MSSTYHPVNSNGQHQTAYGVYNQFDDHTDTPISYDPAESAPIRRRPVAPESRKTLEQPLLIGDSQGLQSDPHGIDVAAGEPLSGYSDEKGKDDYVTSVHSYHSPGLDGPQGSPLDAPLQPKAITRNNLKRYFNGWLVHIPAVGSTAVVMWISVEKWFWFPEDGPWEDVSADIINNILQFAAKLHELLVIASLSAIAVAMMKRSLVGDGVRLGFLTGPYRVGDVNYLISSPFVRQGVNRQMPWEIILVAYLVFATILSTIIGPASAVLLVPTLGWFELSASKAFAKIEMPLLYDTVPQKVWPDVFSSGVVDNDCAGITGIYQAKCPAGGYSEVWNWAQTYRSTDLKNNLTFSYPSADLTRQLVFTQPSLDEASTVPVLSTTPSLWFLNTFGLFQKYVSEQDVGEISDDTRYQLTAKLNNSETGVFDKPILQALVQSKCDVYNKTEWLNKDETILYPVKSLNCFGNDQCLRMQKEPPAFVDTWWRNKTEELTQFATSYRTNGTDEQSSVLFMAGQIPKYADQTRQKDIIYTCAMLASWVASNYSVDPKATDTMQADLNDPNAMDRIFRDGTAENATVITFEESWVDLINPHFNTSTGEPTTALLQFVDVFRDEDEGINERPRAEAEGFLAKVFGVYLTEGIARVGAGAGTYLGRGKTENSLTLVDLSAQYGTTEGRLEITGINDTHTLWDNGFRKTVNAQSMAAVEEIVNNNMEFDFDVRRYGYGTGRPRKTLTFALVMMVVYLGIVVVYALAVGGAHLLELVGVGGRTRVLSVVPWSDLQDLVVLALKTPPPGDADLADAGAGVSSSKAWKKLVRVRADEHRNVQLVLNDETLTEPLDVTGKMKYY
ncbi:hypothetical protein C8035_v000923 [Colletotrichum spinosum]|uniref:Uncharacterized protein n=1 Tax=Colletotrichum spinosum TaxID=1347390 RepID=A0A4R8Q152_9PEZI|nr:hypothetical protein C8035_v000923 [Colletotrichum spinosum]